MSGKPAGLIPYSPGQVLVEKWDQVDLPSPLTMDSLLWAIRRILSKKGIQEIRVRKGKPISVHWFGAESESLDFHQKDPPLSEVIHNIELELLDDFLPPAQLIGEAVLRIDRRGLYVTHSIVGENSTLQGWLRTDPQPNRVGGGAICVDTSLPAYVLILVAGPSPVSSIGQATYGVKITMED